MRWKLRLEQGRFHSKVSALVLAGAGRVLSQIVEACTPLK